VRSNQAVANESGDFGGLAINPAAAGDNDDLMHGGPLLQSWRVTVPDMTAGPPLVSAF
jgi:hypothetical protein